MAGLRKALLAILVTGGLAFATIEELNADYSSLPGAAVNRWNAVAGGCDNPVTSAVARECAWGFAPQGRRKADPVADGWQRDGCLYYPGPFCKRDQSLRD